MIDPATVVDIILLNGNEESGLWEVVWEVRDLYPSVPAESRLLVLRRCVSRLLKEGLLSLYRLPEPYDKPTDISLEESKELILADDSWKVEGSIRLITTDEGEASYRNKDYTRCTVGWSEGED